MRELILILMVGVLSLAAIVNPRIGILGYLWFALCRPDALAYSMGRYPYSLALSAAVILGSLRVVITRVGNLFVSLIPLQFFLLLCVFGVSTIQAVDKNASMMALDQFLRMSVVLFLIPVLIDTIEDLRWAILISAFSIGFIGFYFGFTALARGGVYIYEGVGGSIGDNNMMAIALVVGIPLCWYGIRMAEWLWLKFLLGAMIFGSVATIVMTLSRGAFLGLVAVSFLIASYSKRRVIIFGAFGVMLVPAIILMGVRFQERFNTLKDVQSESSAWSRVEQAKLAVNLARHYVVLGVGPGDESYMKAVTQQVGQRPRNIVHSTPLQVFIHLGLAGVIVYYGLFGTCLLTLYRARRRYRKSRPDLIDYPTALLVAMAGLFVCSLVHPRMTWDASYILAMLTASWQLAERRQAQEHVAAGTYVTPPLASQQSTIQAASMVPAAAERPRERPVSVKRWKPRTMPPSIP
jgi:putative inorganic carbon (HCO3(-)) transporter